jgi:hypothetical protein
MLALAAASGKHFGNLLDAESGGVLVLWRSGLVDA